MSSTAEPNRSLVDAVVKVGGGLAALWNAAGSFFTLLYRLVFLAALLAFFINLTKLSIYAGSSSERPRILKNILTAGICISLLGGIRLAVSILLTLWGI